MTIAPAAEYREISSDLLDEPEHAARETFDETKLMELAQSIRVEGLIEPIVVEPWGDRFQVRAGHRRLLACRMVGMLAVPCMVRAPRGAAGEATKLHENIYREDLNSGEEAAWFGRLLEQHCNGDVDRLCGLLKQSRSYVESRLALLAGDPDVLQALKEQRITFAVAKELNLVSAPGYRASYLDAAVKGGASARLVRDWRLKADALAAMQGSEPGAAASSPTPAPQPAGSVLCCFICDDNHDPHDLDLLYVHRACRKVILDRFLRAYKSPDGTPAHHKEAE